MDYKKSNIRSIRLASFHPHCKNAMGLQAIKEFSLPPFIDASCRREPDFEHRYPSISALCRQAQFAPHLQVNDVIVYTTIKGSWLQDYSNYRLVAILEVIHRYNSHEEAKSWYVKNDNPLPSNCMVSDNSPFPFLQTAGNFMNGSQLNYYLSLPPDAKQHIATQRLTAWNNDYARKAELWSIFLITKPIFLNLNDPPVLTSDDLDAIFHRRISTRTPKIISPIQFAQLAKFASIQFRP